MTDPATPGEALAFLKRASRDTFRICAQSAEALAAEIESGALDLDGVTACRVLASMFTASAQRP